MMSVDYNIVRRSSDITIRLNIRAAVNGMIFIKISIQIIVRLVWRLHNRIIDICSINLYPADHIGVIGKSHCVSITLSVTITAFSVRVFCIRIDSRFTCGNGCAVLRSRNFLGYGFIQLFIFFRFNPALDMKIGADTAYSDKHHNQG